MKSLKSSDKKTPKKAWEVVAAYKGRAIESCDPMGSYTGHPEDVGEVPVQDADDL